jgi:Ca2+ transporting ATPase
LKEYSPDEVKVLRDGAVKKMVTEDLVPGDIVDLVVGDKIPADCRLLSLTSGSLKVDQAILTGGIIRLMNSYCMLKRLVKKVKVSVSAKKLRLSTMKRQSTKTN